MAEVFDGEASRIFRLVIRPPELTLLILAVLLGGLLAGGVLRYVLLGLAWLSFVVICEKFLREVLALSVAGPAVVGLFGPNPEGFLAFTWLTLAGAGILIGASSVIGLSVELLLLRIRSRISSVRFRRRGRRHAGASRPGLRHPEPSRTPRWPSPSQYIVGLAVRRLPAEMGQDERERWEEEMRRDVEDGLPLLRIFYSLGIWLRGAPAMRDAVQDAPRRSPRG